MYLFEFVGGGWQGKQNDYLSLFPFSGRESCRICRSCQEKCGRSLWMLQNVHCLVGNEVWEILSVPFLKMSHCLITDLQGSKGCDFFFFHIVFILVQFRNISSDCVIAMHLLTTNLMLFLGVLIVLSVAFMFSIFSLPLNSFITHIYISFKSVFLKNNFFNLFLF